MRANWIDQKAGRAVIAKLHRKMWLLEIRTRYLVAERYVTVSCEQSLPAHGG
jgi:hypothetical protein